jgi:hypothetical protein
MKNVLYRPSWQKLRVSFLAANHPMQGFNTEQGTDDNLKRLHNYISDAGSNPAPLYVQQEALRMDFSIEEEYACRVWRGLNLLNATHMGYQGQGKSGWAMDVAVIDYRNSLQEVYDGHVTLRADNKWNWDVVQFELEEMWRTERYWFTKIYDDLDRRRKVATKRRNVAGGPGVEQTRKELLRFLALMEQVNRIPTV